MDQLKNRRRSLLWTYFSVIDSNLATCDLCKQKLSHKSSSSNLRKHLLRKHPNVDPATIEPKGTSSLSLKSQNYPPMDPLENCTSFEVPNTSPTSFTTSSSKNFSVSESKFPTDSPSDPLESSPSAEVHHVQRTNFNGSSSKNISSHGRTTEYIKPNDDSSERSRAMDMNEYEAVGVSVAAKLQRMDPVQAIYAESLISQILCKGLLKTLTSTNLSEFIE